MGPLLNGTFGQCLHTYTECYGPYGPGGMEPFWCPHGPYCSDDSDEEEDDSDDGDDDGD